jgi:hypothetical protein
MTQSSNCWQCKHFRITHEQSRPYACGAMGFKSKGLPCHEVSKIDGNRCLSFSPKSTLAGKGSPKVPRLSPLASMGSPIRSVSRYL